MAKPGRPPVLDDAKQREICAIVSVGCPLRVAALYVGCDPRTITRTAEREPTFGRALDRAKSKHEVLNLTSLQAAARQEKNWRAAAWILERMYPQRYAARNPGALTNEQIVQLLEQLAEIFIAELPAKYRSKVLDRVSKLAVPLRGSKKSN